MLSLNRTYHALQSKPDGSVGTHLSNSFSLATTHGHSTPSQARRQKQGETHQFIKSLKSGHRMTQAITILCCKTKREKERDWERQRERQRETDRQTKTDRDRETETERHKQRQKETETEGRDRQTGRQAGRHTDRQRQKIERK